MVYHRMVILSLMLNHKCEKVFLILVLMIT